jgi:endonuclease YncB( thermonuclease family)
VDGDTQHVILDRGWRTTQGITTRLEGVDTPEKNTTAGQFVAQVVVQWLAPICQTKYRLRWLSRDLDKYGRSVGTFVDREHPAESLSDYLIRMELAKPYDGKSARQPWLDSELASVVKAAKSLIHEN